jgi:methionine synthase II (cobalamin-independent)
MAELIPTTVVGSYPQPDWLVDREQLRSRLPPRVRAREIWRVPEPFLEQAQDDATRLAIGDMEQAGVDIITDGEIRRETLHRFAAALVDSTVTPGRLTIRVDSSMARLRSSVHFAGLGRWLMSTWSLWTSIPTDSSRSLYRDHLPSPSRRRTTTTRMSARWRWR